jgi:hypothetical protein
MTEIESAEFAARVNVASDGRTFVRALCAEPAVSALADRIRGDDGPSVTDILSRRVARLAGQATDVRYEHPGDAALAAYLWLIALAFPDAARAAAAGVLERPNLWWARKVAEDVFFSRGAQQGAGLEPVRIDIGPRAYQAATSDRTAPTTSFVVRSPAPWIVAAGSLKRPTLTFVPAMLRRTAPTVTVVEAAVSARPVPTLSLEASSSE